MIDRRHFVKCLAATGIGTATLHRAIAALQDDEESKPVTAEMIAQAEWIAGVELTEEERKELAESASRSIDSTKKLRNSPIGFSDLPAVHFSTLAHDELRLTAESTVDREIRLTESAPPRRPASDEALAFLPVTELAALIRTRQVSSRELTELYLHRLKKYDPLLKCVVTLTEELAMEQSARADREIAAGHYRGPLHGIPWGAKDLIAVPGYPTTWGIPQFQDRTIDQKATVAHRLEQTGAVLVAKLSLGAIAMGDRWFRGKTRSPWNPRIGSSGSSAGSASGVVAGLVGFALGSETLGSIISPCRRCGATGLRPTFGRVSRHGCMPLSWTMDKIGPITRQVEDCAVVLAAVHGHDGLDPTAINRPFHWPSPSDVRQLKVGYVTDDRDVKKRTDLNNLRQLGVELVEVELPKHDALRSLTDVIDVEGASVFQEMLNRDETEGWNRWPRIFRGAQFVTALDYLKRMRIRRQLMHEMEKLMQQVDVLVNASDLVLTNLTGHPSVVLPREIRIREGKYSPRSDIFTGRLFDESTLLNLAQAYQQLVDGHTQHPPLDELQRIIEKERLEAEKQKKENATENKNGNGAGQPNNGGNG